MAQVEAQVETKIEIQQQQFISDLQELTKQIEDRLSKYVTQVVEAKAKDEKKRGYLMIWPRQPTGLDIKTSLSSDVIQTLSQDFYLRHGIKIGVKQDSSVEFVFVGSEYNHGSELAADSKHKAKEWRSVEQFTLSGAPDGWMILADELALADMHSDQANFYYKLIELSSSKQHMSCSAAVNRHGAVFEMTQGSALSWFQGMVQKTQADTIGLISLASFKPEGQVTLTSYHGVTIPVTAGQISC